MNTQRNTEYVDITQFTVHISGDRGEGEEGLQCPYC